MHPDIADMEEAATGTDPADQWGWFEIKPMYALARAFEELVTYYLPPWNEHVAVIGHPEWRSIPGTWQPPPIGWVPGVDPPKLFAALTVPRGCIGYFTLDPPDKEWIKEVVLALAAMAALIQHQLREQLRELFPDRLDPGHPVFVLLAMLLMAVVLAIKGFVLLSFAAVAAV